MKNFKIIALLLVCVMALTALIGCTGVGKSGGKSGGTKDGKPTDKRVEADVNTVKTTLENAKAGDKFTLGSWEQDGKNNGAEAISWIVIYQDVGKALVLSEKVIEYGYFITPKDDGTYARTIYRDSDLRKYLTNDFYNNAFTDNEKKLILKTSFDMPYYEDEQLKTATLEDSVFPLSYAETTKYVTGKGNLIHGAPTDFVKSNYGDRMSGKSDIDGFGLAVSWWLRDTGDSTNKACYVPGYDNRADTYGWDVGYRAGIRPAMWIVYNEADMNGYANGTVKPKEDAELNAKIRALKVGDKFGFGVIDENPYYRDGYEELEWQVLDEDDTSYLIITTGVVNTSRYAENGMGSNENKDKINWSTSYIRSVINGDAYINGLFNPQEKAKLILTHVNTSGSNDSWNRDGGPETEDYLFIPDISELDRYLPEQSSRASKDNYEYWLRNPSFTAPYMAYVYSNGDNGSHDATDYCGIRLMARIAK